MIILSNIGKLGDDLGSNQQHKKIDHINIKYIEYFIDKYESVLIECSCLIKICWKGKTLNVTVRH